MSEKLASPSKKLRLGDHDDPILKLASGHMSTEAHSTPISMLSDDVLYFIFSINSVMEMKPFNKEMITTFAVRYEGGALTTNRYSSQVCRRWRNIILSSPMIWANCLNIDELNQRREEWRWEVLKRTGDAPITLIGRVQFTYADEGNHVKEFVEDVLTHDWERIRYLSICTDEGDLTEDMYYMMQEPAPMLEYFLYWTTLYEGMDDDPDEPPTILFDGYSPKLTFFCCDGVKYDLTQGSMDNLRQLWLPSRRAAFTIAELYNALRELPLLEELKMDHYELLDNVGLPENTPTLSLPRLVDITIHFCGMMLVSKLVKYIQPARGCRLVVARENGHKSDSPVDVLELSQAYATFIKEFADFKVPYLSLWYHRGRGFNLRAATSIHWEFFLTDLPSNYPNISFAFSSDEFLGGPLSLDQFSVPVMKALLSRTDLGHITILNLLLDENAVIRAQPQVLALLKKLGSVEHLTTDVQTLLILIDIQAALGLDVVIFPHLTTVHIVLTGEADPNWHDLSVFLDGRSKTGNPVQFLELPKETYNNDGRWKFLDEICGLSVVWCGRLGFEKDPKKVQFVERNGSLVPAWKNTITSTNLG